MLCNAAAYKDETEAGDTYLLVECGERLPRSAPGIGAEKPGWNGAPNGDMPYIPGNGYMPAPSNDCVVYSEAAAEMDAKRTADKSFRKR